MAIAYYIPDQSKLLANNNPTNNNNNNNNSSNSAAAQNSANQASAGTSAAANMPQQQQQQQQQQQPPQQQNANNNFYAGITIPLLPNNAAPSAPDQVEVGCWDLVTQFFCFVMRHYQQTRSLNSAVLHISFEVNAGGGASETLVTPPTTSMPMPTMPTHPAQAGVGSRVGAESAAAAATLPNANQQPNAEDAAQRN